MKVKSNGFVGEWKVVNKGTTQGSFSGLEVNLLDEPVLAKYADDSNLISPVYDLIDLRPKLNSLWSGLAITVSCDPSKCKEIVFRKKGCTQVFRLPSSISQTTALSILGVTFQEDCGFTTHVRNKLIIANKCLFILRSLRKEGYT